MLCHAMVSTKIMWWPECVDVYSHPSPRKYRSWQPSPVKIAFRLFLFCLVCEYHFDLLKIVSGCIWYSRRKRNKYSRPN